MSFNNLNQVIPDNDSSGITSSQTVNLPSAALLSVSVSLQLSGVGSGGYNGDLYVLLSHAGASSVLLNRVGKTASNPFGYGDNGLSVTFSDSASNGDIHLYQTVSNPGGGLLTGTWQPDGRRTDPGAVTDSSPRTAFLSNFAGLSNNGKWNLYLVDLSGGAQLRLDSWSLNLAVVPEPSAWGNLFGIVLGAYGISRQFRLRGRVGFEPLPSREGLCGAQTPKDVETQL